jgi:hypothetical protein
LADIIKLAKHAPWGKIPIIGNRLPKGFYFVGDPAFILHRNDWDAFLAAFYAVSDDAAIFNFKGRKCFVSSTNRGAGIYYDRGGTKYSAPSGLIGVVPHLVTSDTGFTNRLSTGGFFPLPFHVGADPGHGKFKRIRIGNCIIDT